MNSASSARRLFALDGQVALVTGATGGLGQAIALAYAQNGASLVLSDRDDAALRDIAARCASLGGAVQTVVADLSAPAQVQALAERAQAAFGPIDLLVCNAGMQGPAGPLLEVPAEDWARVFQVNLASAHALCAALLPAMGERGHGRVVLMASIAALRGNGAIGLYGLSKAALAQMARNLAVEWGPRGVCVNAIAPGLIRTPLAEGLMANGAFMARRLAATPLRRVGEPHEVAGVAVMLASAAGGFITGQTLVVDGGTVISDGS
ncbi:short-chain dehydrogenase [Xenophilus aerolatus]|nr:short-chain dehydrogenase [Xenophilus aerolatus]